jgi:hypothetical protein
VLLTVKLKNWHFLIDPLGEEYKAPKCTNGCSNTGYPRKYASDKAILGRKKSKLPKNMLLTAEYQRKYYL